MRTSFTKFWRHCKIEQEDKGVYLIMTDYETYLRVDTAHVFRPGLEGWKIVHAEGMLMPNEERTQDIFNLLEDWIEDQIEPVYTDNDNYGIFNQSY